IGPSVGWDDPNLRPPTESLQWLTIEPKLPAEEVPPIPTRRIYRYTKRAFDVAFGIFAILVTLPLYPLIMAAIWIEDGWPLFFTHQRETMGGGEFPCLTFRSMRKDAATIKKQIKKLNQAPGQQFY